MLKEPLKWERSITLKLGKETLYIKKQYLFNISFDFGIRKTWNSTMISFLILKNKYNLAEFFFRKHKKFKNHFYLNYQFLLSFLTI